MLKEGGLAKEHFWKKLLGMSLHFKCELISRRVAVNSNLTFLFIFPLSKNVQKVMGNVGVGGHFWAKQKGLFSVAKPVMFLCVFISFNSGSYYGHTVL